MICSQSLIQPPRGEPVISSFSGFFHLSCQTYLLGDWTGRRSQSPAGRACLYTWLACHVERSIFMKGREKAKLQSWNWGEPPISTPSHPIPSHRTWGCRAAAQRQVQQTCFSSVYICMHKNIHNYTCVCVYYTQTVKALLFYKLHTKNKLETQLSQQQSWTWRRRAGG